MKRYAASKFYLKIAERDPDGSVNDPYTYHDTRKEAAQALVKREQAAIALTEANLKRCKSRLRAFVKKEGVNG